MKLLIDGCAFEEGEGAKLASFWDAMISLLLETRSDIAIYFLNRGFRQRFQDQPRLINLYAPEVEWGRSALEDRRLAFLCRELGVDLFVSTSHTSAGGKVASLLVIGSSMQALLDSALKRRAWASARRARKLASAIWVIPGGVSYAPALAAELAGPMAAAAERSSAEERERRAGVDLATARRAELERDRPGRPQKLSRRIYRALASPARYPDYLRRLLQRSTRTASNAASSPALGNR